MINTFASNKAVSNGGAANDLFSVEVVRQGLSSIAEEITLITMRAARSPAIREAGDLSSALADSEGGLIAQGRDLPIHLGVIAFTVKALLATAGIQNIAEGDIWIVNHPLVGGRSSSRRQAGPADLLSVVLNWFRNITCSLGRCGRWGSGQLRGWCYRHMAGRASNSASPNRT